MTVYVDNARIPYGRMKMSHMLADSRQELLNMAMLIGLDTKHLQNKGQPNEHFDVSATYRQKAIAAGAVEVDQRTLVKIIRAKRAGRTYGEEEPFTPTYAPKRFTGFHRISPEA